MYTRDVDDLAGLEQRLRGAGVSIFSGPEEIDVGPGVAYRLLPAQGPDGEMFELVERQRWPRSHWRAP